MELMLVLLKLMGYISKKYIKFYIKYNKNEKIKLFEIQEKYLTDFVKKKDATAYDQIITNLHYSSKK